jgi:hypothetical protein
MGNENELLHLQYGAPAASLKDLRPVKEMGGSTAWVWDLAVIDHQRKGWVECVLSERCRS